MVRIVFCFLSFVLVAVAIAGAQDAEPSQQGWAALVIDVQPCFVEGGSLAVSGANKAYVSKVQRDTKWLQTKGYLIFGSRDYHPPNHISFYTNHSGANPFDVINLGTPENPRWQVLWPPHCVQTIGDSRELVDNNIFFELIKKGQDPLYDSYSAFRDDGGEDTELHSILQAKGVTHLVVYGIATDYCVKASVLDAIERGYSVIVVEDLIRGVAPDTSAAAIAEMKAAGAEFVSSVRNVK